MTSFILDTLNLGPNGTSVSSVGKDTSHSFGDDDLNGEDDSAQKGCK